MEFLPNEVAAALRDAQTKAMRRQVKLTLHAGGQVWPILRKWHGGLALNADQIKQLRGHVDIYRAGTHVATALIVASEIEGQELICQLKRETAVSTQAPLDFVRDDNAPAGYLPSA
ncbi:hypothetical protein BFP70_17560 [Thioclava sp. SK-1]|uniref:hypothetical protein n=1 Tax=Thioclava sp. SK-1 TaxID=1889770 RepID=UPI0008265FD6|nr:hypothetical protein [Thioclava sp. SK-1]OCX60418.1 hypothetical protein BFP70_17560 [Thioclava sp. SK-1]